MSPGYSDPVRAFVVTLALGALVVVGCGSGDDGGDLDPVAAPPMESQPAPSPIPAPTPPPQEPEDPGAGRAAAPPIGGRSLDGTPVSLSDFAGRPVLINVWSSW